MIFQCNFYYLDHSSNQDQSNLATQESSGLGETGYRAVFEAVHSTKINKQKHYHWWTEKEQYSIRIYSAKNGSAAVVRKLKEKLLHESTARGFAKLHKEKIKGEAKEKRDPKESVNCNAKRKPSVVATSQCNSSKVFDSNASSRLKGHLGHS